MPLINTAYCSEMLFNLLLLVMPLHKPSFDTPSHDRWTGSMYTLNDPNNLIIINIR